MLALSLTLISALLYASLFPPYGAVVLSWVALVPLFLALADARPGGAALLGAVFACVMTAIIIAWVVPTARDYFETPTWAALSFLGLLCVTTTAPYYAAAGALLSALRPHLGRTAWWLLVPAAWVAAEYSRSQLGLRSAWALLGDAHHESARLRQVADLGGVYAVGALVALGNAAVAAWIHGRLRSGSSRGRAHRPVAVAFAVCLVAALGYGSWRASPAPPEGEPLQVAIVQGNLGQSLRWNRVHASRVLRTYGALTRRALRSAEPRPELVVWPENALQTGLADPVYGPPLLRLVKREGIPLLTGIPRSEDGRHYNSALLLAPGAEPLHYDKVRLLPFVESRPFAALRGAAPSPAASRRDYSPGEGSGLLPAAGRTFGALICLEATYPNLARAAVRAGADALVNLSNDGWYAGTAGVEQHFQQVVFRAVENRVPVVRATSTGISAVIDPTGEVLARLGEGQSEVLHAAVPAARAASPYTRFGDAFAVGWCAALVGASALAAARRRRRPGAA